MKKTQKAANASRRHFVKSASIQLPQAQDVYFSLEQKGVDMRLGINVATLSNLNKYVANAGSVL
jgi:hypothetical protein